MELKLQKGRYVTDEYGAIATVSGREEKIQRVLCRLSARRGAFFPMKSFGSRLYTLPSFKPSARKAAAAQFVHEALAEEEGVEILSVDCTDGADDSCLVQVELSIDGGDENMTLRV